jgi:nucleotide-binding universal stress UspA family protein
MKIQKVLFPTDFSPAAMAAFPLAQSLARDSNALLVIVHVDETEPRLVHYVFPEPERSELFSRLEAVLPDDPAIAYEHRLVAGDAAETIVAMPERDNVDLIVMGTHGRTGLVRMLMGSVAERVVRRASCPVLTIRQPTGALAHADTA